MNYPSQAKVQYFSVWGTRHDYPIEDKWYSSLEKAQAGAFAFTKTAKLDDISIYAHFTQGSPYLVFRWFAQNFQFIPSDPVVCTAPMNTKSKHYAIVKKTTDGQQIELHHEPFPQVLKRFETILSQDDGTLDILMIVQDIDTQKHKEVYAVECNATRND